MQTAKHILMDIARHVFLKSDKKISWSFEPVAIRRSGCIEFEMAISLRARFSKTALGEFTRSSQSPVVSELSTISSQTMFGGGRLE